MQLKHNIWQQNESLWLKSLVVWDDAGEEIGKKLSKMVQEQGL